MVGISEIIRGLLGGIVDVFKAIFGMNKPKETEVNETGQNAPPKSNFDDRLDRMRNIARSESEGSDNNSSHVNSVGESDGNGNSSR